MTWKDRPFEERIELVKAMHVKGQSFTYIADALNVTRSTIAGFVSRNRKVFPARRMKHVPPRVPRSMAQRNRDRIAQNQRRARKRGTLAAVGVRPTRTSNVPQETPRPVRKPVEVKPTPPLLTNPVSLMDHKEGQCRWVIEPRTYCGAPIEANKSYCPHHCARAYMPKKQEGVKN